MEIDERTGSIAPAGVMATACTHRRPDATREAPTVIAEQKRSLDRTLANLVTKLTALSGIKLREVVVSRVEN
jgi:hypothetical protein